MTSNKQLIVMIVFVFMTFFLSMNDAASLKFEVPEQNCSLQFHPCPDVKHPVGKLDGSYFNGTCQGPVALLKKGTHVMIHFKFESDVEETSLKSVVCGQIGYLPCVDFPLAQPDACKDSGLKCPVAAHHVVDYDSLLDVKSLYPSVSVFVRWELKDQNNNDVFCGVVPAKIV